MVFNYETSTEPLLCLVNWFFGLSHVAPVHDIPRSGSCPCCRISVCGAQLHSPRSCWGKPVLDSKRKSRWCVSVLIMYPDTRAASLHCFPFLLVSELCSITSQVSVVKHCFEFYIQMYVFEQTDVHLQLCAKKWYLFPLLRGLVPLCLEVFMLQGCCFCRNNPQRFWKCSAYKCVKKIQSLSLTREVASLERKSSLCFINQGQ